MLTGRDTLLVVVDWRLHNVAAADRRDRNGFIGSNTELMNEHMHFFDNQTLSFKCPRCGGCVTRSVAELKRPQQKCPHCRIGFQESEFKRAIDEAEQQVTRFKRQLRNIKIDIKL